MSHVLKFGAGLAIVAAIAFQTGCEKAADSTSPATVPDAPPTLADDHGHDHAAHGPHGGEIVEFASGDYHAELVHNDAEKSVEIYILDGEAKATVAIDAPTVTINVPHEGEPLQFELKPAPLEGEPAPRTSRYASTDATLLEELDHGHEATLVVSIDGKQYRGGLAHDHDHEGHDHDHE